MAEAWIEKYIDLMFGPHHTFGSMTEAARLKYLHMPEKLYKYRGFSDYTWKDLENDTLIVRKTSLQNDKREANIIVTQEAEASIFQQLYDEMYERYGFPKTTVQCFEDIENIAKEQFNKRVPGCKERDIQDFMDTTLYKSIKRKEEAAFADLINGVRKRAREMYSICSFSATKDSVLMWAHYADSNKGCCIEYDFKGLGSEDLHVALMFPVIYVEDNRVYLNYYNPDEGLDGSIGMFAATLKEKDWEYEHEWRRLYTADQSGIVQSMPKPTAVYMGEDISEGNKDKLIEMCTRRGIQLFSTRYDQNEDKIIAY